MKCEECFSSEAIVVCIVCEQVLCKQCEESLHKGGKRRMHSRPPVCRNCKNQALTQCTQCGHLLCSSCSQLHSAHILREIATSKKIGVFWDISTCRPTRSEDIQMLLADIQQKLGAYEFIKTYGDPWGKWKDALTSYDIASVHKSGIKTIEALILDISISLNLGLTHVFIISAQAQTFTPHLMQLKSNMPGIEFWLSSRILPIQIQETLTEEPKPEKKLTHMDSILTFLKEEAFKGNVLIQLQEFLHIISQKLKLDIEEVSKLLNQADQSRAVHISCKEFNKVTSNFVSLRVENCTLECLTWTLRSLCVDEMLPSEKAIQARMREVFDFKPTQSDWQTLIHQARGHSHSNSAPEFSFFSKPSTLPKFIFKEITDIYSGSRTLLIYPSGEVWQALDNNSKLGDYLNIKNNNEWKEFLKFLENYYSPKGIRRPKKEDEQKAIPGGRYGCAQFIKLCGPVSLRNCSLGRLSYMVQLAINEDLLRYQRTLLIWTTNNHGIISKAEMVKKLQVIKTAVISILERSNEGVSLAQLPLFLKRSLTFSVNLSDLGFAKLKDLLATFPEVAIELRDTNHPFAVLRKDNKYTPPPPESILTFISVYLGDNQLGLQDFKIEEKIIEKFGRIEWGAYHTPTLADFVQSFGRDRFQVIKSRDLYMIFKSRKPEYSCFYEPFRDNSWDFVNERESSPTPTIMHYNSMSSDIHMPGHMSKKVNISDLPPDIVGLDNDEPNYFFEVCNDSSTDISYSMPRSKGRSRLEDLIN